MPPFRADFWTHIFITKHAEYIICVHESLECFADGRRGKSWSFSARPHPGPLVNGSNYTQEPRRKTLPAGHGQPRFEEAFPGDAGAELPGPLIPHSRGGLSSCCFQSFQPAQVLMTSVSRLPPSERFEERVPTDCIGRHPKLRALVYKKFSAVTGLLS